MPTRQTAARVLALVFSGWLSLSDVVPAAELILAADGQSDYQIVLPEKTPAPIIDRALAQAAQVMREMFQSNGCAVPVVQESQANKQQPGIYLGDTVVARAAEVEAAQLPVWAYVWKTAGPNVILAGRDWPAAKQQDGGERSCCLGTVKAMTDFLREFCGTRFLAPGGLVGIEFLPTPKIVIPVDLNRRRDPLVNYNIGGRPTIEVNEIGLNLLNNVTTEYFAHTHELAVPAEKYAEQHPEYFALVNGQRIREHPHPWKPGVMVKEPHLCYSNKHVQELIYQDMLRSLDAGYPEYLSLQADGFQPCTCDECQKLFDTSDWGEKLWLLNKRWAERLLKDRPGKFLVVTAYTVTGKPPAAFKDFPPNMRVSVGSYQQAFDTWKDCAIPGGFVTYLHAWGGYHLCGYLPVRTPQYAERTVRMYDRYHVKGVGLDSPPAIMWGLEGPTVYVYSRMFDDVQNLTAQQLVEEYIQAAYGPAAPPMTRLFDELHHTLQAYAEVFGVDNGTFQHYTRTDGRSVRYLTWQTKLRLIGFLYPPETLRLLESHLAQAEQTAGLSDKQRLRLALVRREFDYLKGTVRVVHMYNAYQTRPNKNTLGELLAEMETRQKTIMAWYDTGKRPYRPGVWTQEPIAPQWPMYIGGAGYYNDHLLRNGGSYLSEPVPPFTWNIGEMRKSPLLAATPTVVNLCGTPTEVGERWGTVNRQAIRHAMERYLAKAKTEKLSEQTLIERAQPFVEIVKRVAPHWIEESRAIARAADLDADLYLSFLANSPRNIGFHECTSYAVSKEFTPNHAILFHKNRDNVDCEQAAYVLTSSVKGVNKFIAVSNASAVNCSMMVNDRGLAGSGDYPAHLTRKGDPHALVPEAAEPRFRGMMNDLLLRHIAERAADCRQALNIIQDFSNNGYYAGGTVNGTHWLFVDRTGTIMEVSSNARHVASRIHTQKVYFSRLDGSPAATRLNQAAGPIDFHLFHNVSRDPSICLKSSISGMTVEIDAAHPDFLTCAWISLPAKSLSFPVFMGGRKTPRCLISGDLYKAGKSLDTDKSQWEILERHAHADKQQLAGRVAALLKAEQRAEAIALLDTWTQATANAQLAIVLQHCQGR